MSAPLHASPWGPEIATYLVLTGAISGAALVAPWMAAPWMASSAEMFGARRHLRVAALSLLLFGASFVLLTLDLGRPSRFWTMLSGFNTASPMSFGVRLLVLEASLTLACWLLLRRRAGALAEGDPTLARGVTATLYVVVPALTWFAGLAMAAYPAWLLSKTWVAPLAAGSTAPLAFLSSALMLGWGIWATSIWAASNEPHRGGPAVPAIATVVAIPHAIVLGANGTLPALVLMAAATLPTLFARRAHAPFLAILSGSATRVFLLHGAIR